MVSEPFDFIKVSLPPLLLIIDILSMHEQDTSQLIHFFCSVAFANDHELGWDPSIGRMLVNGRVQYEITLNSPTGASTYVTTDILADFGAKPMEGRGTRVFTGYRKGDPDKTPVVIKDTWRASDRKREDVILKEIFTDMVNMMGEVAAKDAQKHFLDANDVVIEGNLDDTHFLLHGSNPPSNCKMYEIPLQEPPDEDELSRDTTSTYTVADFKVSHKIHTRIVFKEVCETLYAVHEDGVTLPPEQDKAFRSLFPKYIPAERLRHLMVPLKVNVPIAFRYIIACIEMIRRRLVNTYAGPWHGRVTPTQLRTLSSEFHRFFSPNTTTSCRSRWGYQTLYSS